jgi:hypothetical protein
MNRNTSISSDHPVRGRARLGHAVLAVGIAASAFVVSGSTVPATGATAIHDHDEGPPSTAATWTIRVPCFIQPFDRWPVDAPLPTCTRTYLK